MKDTRSKKVYSVVIEPMTTTMKQFFRSLIRPSTLLYPFEKLESGDKKYFGVNGDIWSRYRGWITLNLPACISCGACARACPNKCCVMEKVVDDPDSITKTHMHPRIDFARCLFCELCVQACPVTDCLNMTSIYDITEYDRKDLFYTPKDLYVMYKKAKMEKKFTTMSQGKVASKKE
ncbi:MAG: NADH-quinone oxidoreductase subunit I [Candidatus Thermoplasmatota archaeon]|nr:NADH-quinone oxidoreductase subunit I [Candidatus Thermoplasmatota archaeon]